MATQEVVSDTRDVIEDSTPVETPSSPETPSLINTLGESLKNQNPKVRVAAAEALGKTNHPDAVSYLVERGKVEEKWSVHYKIIQELYNLRDFAQPAIPFLTDLVNAEVKNGDIPNNDALRTLCFLDIDNTIVLLTQFAKHSQEKIRYSAMDHLARINNQQTTSVLESYSASDDPTVRFKALIALLQRGNRKAMQTLEMLFPTLRIDNKTTVINLCAVYLEDESVPILNRLLTTLYETHGLKGTIYQALCAVGTQQAINSLIKNLTQDERATDVYPIKQFIEGVIKNPGVFKQILLEELKQQNARILPYIIPALMAIEAHEAVPDLIKICNRQTPPIEAIQALGRLGGIDGLACLQNILDKNTDNSLTCIAALEAIRNILSRTPKQSGELMNVPDGAMPWQTEFPPFEIGSNYTDEVKRLQESGFWMKVVMVTYQETQEDGEVKKRHQTGQLTKAKAAENGLAITLERYPDKTIIILKTGNTIEFLSSQPIV